VIRPLLFAVGFTLACCSLVAQNPAWQPSAGHTQVLIWPGNPRDAVFGPPADTETTETEGSVAGVEGTQYPITRWPELVETWLRKIRLISP
jgi:hypothetical protein